MGKEKEKEVLTGFSNKYEVDESRSLEELENEVNSLPKAKAPEVQDRSLLKWIILTSIAIGAIVLFTILANI